MSNEERHHGEKNTNEELARRIETALGGFRAFLQNMETKIMTDLSDLQDAMTAVEAAVDKNATDTAADVAEIKALLDQIATGGVSAVELQALTTRAKAVADKIVANNAALEGAIPVLQPSPAPAPTA